jgi:hypothetical protein
VVKLTMFVALGFTFCHVNGPTLVVISVVPLNAKASNTQLSGPEGDPLDRQVVESVAGWVGTLAMVILVIG